MLAAARASGARGPFVLVGHSMGGRVAMRLAADHPAAVAALVIEDMDVAPRVPSPPPPGGVSAAPVGDDDVAAPPGAPPLLARFFDDDGEGGGGNGALASRRFETFEDAVGALAPIYGAPRVREWEGSRVREQHAPSGGGTFWHSDINPLAQARCRDGAAHTGHGPGMTSPNHSA